MNQLEEGRTIQEANLIGQFQTEDIAPEVRFDDSADRCSQVTVQDEEDTHAQSNQNSDQEVRENNRDERDQEGNELVPTFAPHLAKQFGTGQFESSD